MTKDEIIFIEKLYKSTYNNVRKICSSRLRTGFDIDDCLIKVYIIATEKVKILLKHESPEKWIYVTTYNIVKEKYREQKLTNQTVSIDSIVETLPDVNLENNSDSNYNKLFEYIYSNLKPKERELFTLRYIRNKSVKEIANILNISYTNVTTKCGRLKSKLKNIIKAFYKTVIFY